MPCFLKIVVSFVLILSLVSCGEDKTNNEIVDLEDFLPKSKKDYNYKKDTIVSAEKYSPDSLELFIQSAFNGVRFLSKSELKMNKHFPDRLDYSQKFYHRLSLDSTLYELVVWEFEDSLHTVNAFYNWMDCFGNKCKSIRIGESKWIYDGSFELFVDDKKIIYITSDKNIDEELWSNLFQPELKSSWSYHIYQPLKRKVKWLAFNK